MRQYSVSILTVQLMHDKVPAMASFLTMSELADQAKVSARTIRYYIQEGLLPSPGASGPGAHYDRSYLDRIRLIKRLQKAHLPLSEIRARIAPLDEREVRDLLNPEKAEGSAGDYARAILVSRGVPLSISMEEPLLLSMDEPVPARSRWERVRVDPDIEIHTRSPIPREKQRVVERLLEMARDLLQENEP